MIKIIGIKSKKGQKDILLPEVVKILLAALLIIGLIYLAFLLFSIFKNQTQIKQAEGALEEIVGKFNMLKEGEQATYLFIAPSKWYIKNPVIVVQECKSRNCICLCKESDCSGSYMTGENVIVCKDIDKPIIFQDSSGGGVILELNELKIPKEFTLLRQKDNFILRLKV